MNKKRIAQLTTRLGWPDSKGRLALESKQDMRGRSLSSPDRADAVLGAMMNMAGGSGGFTKVEARERHNGMTGLNGERMATYARRGRVLI